MAADGSITVTVDLDDKEAQNQLNKIKRQIEELNRETDITKARKTRLEKESDKAAEAVDRAKKKLAELETERDRLFSMKNYTGEGASPENVVPEDFLNLSDKIEANNNAIKEQKQMIKGYQKDFDAAAEAVEKVDKALAENEETLGVLKEYAGKYELQLAHASPTAEAAAEAGEEIAEAASEAADNLEEAGDAIEEVAEAASDTAENLEEVGDAGEEAGEEISEAMKHAESRIEKLGNRILGLAKRVFVFSLITSALRGLRTWVGNAIKQNDEAAASIAQLKGALLTLAQPIIEFVIPVFVDLVKWITKVITSIASLVSMLFGKTLQQSADAAKALYEEQNAIEGVGSAAKEASKYLAPFDELNVMAAESAGGGGGASGSKDIVPSFDFSDYEPPDWLKKLKDWLTPLPDWFDNLKQKVADFVAELLSVPDTISVDVGVNMTGFVTGLAVVDGAIVGTSAALDALRKKVGETGEVVANGFSGAAAGAVAALEAIENGTEITQQSVGQSVTAMTKGALASTSILKEGVTADAKVTQNAVVKSATETASNAITQYKRMQTQNTQSMATLKANTTETANSIEATTSNSLNHTTQNVTTFSHRTASAFTSWGGGIKGIFGAVAAVIGVSMYTSMQSAANNVVSAENGMTRATNSWAPSFANVFVSIGRAIATNIGAGLKVAWENYKNFLNATGEKVKTWWNENKSWAAPALIATGVTVGAIALAPYTGGLSLAAIPALAQGAVIPPNREFLAVLGDQRRGTNIEAPEDLIRQIVREEGGGGNNTVVIGLLREMLDYLAAGQVIEMDNREFGRATTKAVKTAMRTGALEL